MTTAYLAETLPLEYSDGSPIPTDGERIAGICKQLAALTMSFARIGRAPRYCENHKENNAEHSFMVAIVSMELARQFRPDLDVGTVAQMAIVHDLSELKTSKVVDRTDELVTDVATFMLGEAEIARKKADDAAATHELVPDLPPYIGQLLLRYETQQEPASRYVRMVDKNLPAAVDLLGAGKKVMAEEFGITDRDGVVVAEHHLGRRLRRMFPDPDLSSLHDARDILAAEFAATYG